MCTEKNSAHVYTCSDYVNGYIFVLVCGYMDYMSVAFVYVCARLLSLVKEKGGKVELLEIVGKYAIYW